MIENYDKTVFHFDGNNNDPDDIAALPIAALLAKAAGIEGEIVFFYGNNLAEKNDAGQLDKMKTAANFAESLGIETVGYQDDIDGGTAQLQAIFNNSDYDEVLVIDGGPMEATYRALQGTQGNRLDNITQISHSSWNEDRDVVNRPGVEVARTWDDIADDFPGVDQIRIRDQNQHFRDNDWFWMDSASNDTVAAARDIMELAPNFKKNDPSDAGMLYYALTGDEAGDPNDVQEFLSSGADLDPDDPVTTPGGNGGAQDGEDDDPQDGESGSGGGGSEEETPPQAPDEGGTDAGTLVAAYNIGGDAFEGADGIQYASDTVSNGQTYRTGGQTSIAGTQDDALFRSEAWRAGQLDVEIDQIPEGTYRVELDFAEIFGPTSKDGGRVFDIQIEGGAKELDDFDIFAEAGANTALVKSFDVEVTDGTLNIELSAEVENPKLSALRVFAAEEPASPEGTGGSGGDGSASVIPQGFEAALVDTDTNLIIEQLEGNDTISFNKVAGRDVGLVVTSNRDDVDGVTLAMDGTERTERVEPYALFGDTDGDYFDGVSMTRGDKSLSVEAFDAGGTGLASFDVDFFIV